MRAATTLSLIALSLGACASGPSAALDPNGTQWTGWVKFTGEEFELYADHDQVRRPFARPCLSGALPRDLQRQASADLAGAKVQVTGRTTVWASGSAGYRIDREGAVITNTCGGAVVILADSMEPV